MVSTIINSNHDDDSVPKGFIHSINLFVCRYFYSAINSPEFKRELIEDQKKLAPAQIDRLANGLIDIIIKHQIKFDWLERFHQMSKQNFDIGYIKLKRYLETNEIFRENFLGYLQEMIMIVFGLITGTIKSSEVHGFKKKIVDNLKLTYGFNTRNESFESIESLLTIFLCRYIYYPIIIPEFASKLKNGPIKLTETQIDNIIKRLINETNYKNWLIQLTNKERDQFKEDYKDFEERLKFDQLYNESYIENIHKLIKFMFELVSWKVNASDLHGFERVIVNDLKKCSIFLYDPELSKVFKFNITIFYCRYFHQIIKYLKSKDIIKKNQKSLPSSIIEPIIRGFGELPPYHKIRDEFLDGLNERSKEMFHQFNLKLRVRLKWDQIYYESYLEYLREQLNFVFAIVTGRVNEPGQSTLERVLIRELKNKPIDKHLLKELDQIFKDEQKSHINQYNNEKIIQDLRNKICNFIFSELSKKKTRKLTLKLIKKSFNLNPYLKALALIGVDDYLAKNIEKYLIAVPLIIEPYFSNDKDIKPLTLEKIHKKSSLNPKQILLISKNFEKTFGKNTYNHLKRFPEISVKKDSSENISLKPKGKEFKNNESKINQEKLKKSRNQMVKSTNDNLTSDSSFSLKENEFDIIWEKFLHYTHKIEVINNLVIEFNKRKNWMKLFCPTKTFLDYLEKKRMEAIQDFKNNKSNITKVQIEILSEYITLITQIKNENILIKIIRNLILENKGQFNAFDIQNWLLITDNAARNQLKRMFTKEEYQEYIRTQKHVTIETIKVIAKKKGGKCHTKKIKNAKSRITLECAEGHQFTTTFNSVVYQNTWCPDCHIYVSETICRKYFERIFKKPFPKSYPEWLINENGNQMELDGYNKDLSLAFEYQGIQHRKIAFGKTDKDLQKIQQEDVLKLKLCGEHNVNLLQIPDDKIVPYDEMQAFIESKYEKETGNILKNIPIYNYKDFVIYENKHAKKFMEYVENKGGILLTPYFSAKKEVTLICENGHQWTTTPNSIYRDNWCSFCAGNMKGEIEFFREIGKKFNCELISEYVNAKTPLWYKCPKGHKFKKSPYWLKKNYENNESLCPDCIMDIYAKNFQEFISKKREQILTPYKGRFKPINIKCKNGHIRKTTPAAVYQGNYCKLCKK